MKIFIGILAAICAFGAILWLFAVPFMEWDHVPPNAPREKRLFSSKMNPVTVKLVYTCFDIMSLFIIRMLSWYRAYRKEKWPVASPHHRTYRQRVAFHRGQMCGKFMGVPIISPYIVSSSGRQLSEAFLEGFFKGYRRSLRNQTDL